MKHQLQTIREFIESAHEGEWASYVDRDAALTALSELERLVGEPVAWPTMPPSKGQSPVLFEDGYAEGWAKCLSACKALFAAPPAQQPHERHLLNLLARIHGDGGHYTAEHGLEKSVSDADQKVADLHLKAWEAQQPQRITPAELAKRIERGEKWQLDEQPVGRVDGDGHVTWFAPIPEGGANLYAAQQPQAEAVPEMHDALCPALAGGGCTCTPTTTDKAWAQFCGGIGRGPDAPYPGMIEAFESHYGQTFTDKDWREETGVWAAAWKAAKAHGEEANQQAEAVPKDHPLYVFATEVIHGAYRYTELPAKARAAIDAAMAQGEKP